MVENEDMNPQRDQDYTDSEAIPAEKPVYGEGMNRANKPKLVIIIMVLVIAAITSAVLLSKSPGGKIYGQVGTYKVTQGELDTLAKESPSAKKDELVTLLLDLNLYRQAATTAGIKVSQDDVTKEFKKRTGSVAVSNQNYLTDKVELDMLRQQLTTRVLGNTQGRVITIHFDQHFFVFGPGDLSPGETEALRPQYIAADRAAADALKDTIYKQLQDKKINFDQAMQLEKSDPKLGEKALPTSFHSQAFNTNDVRGQLTGLLAQSDLKQLIDSTKIGSYSAPTLIKLQLTEKTSQDGIYAIVQVDSRPGKLADSLDSFISAQKKQLKYKKTL